MHTIGFVVFPNFYMMGFAAVTVFELANLVLHEPAYAVAFLRWPLGQGVRGMPVSTIHSAVPRDVLKTPHI